jgi:hypothetical protein
LKEHLDMTVLAAPVGRPAHGYGIIQEIKRRSGGAFDPPEGTDALPNARQPLNIPHRRIGRDLNVRDRR